MAISPKWKVYDSHGRYVASCKEPEAAAMLSEWYGKGSTVRVMHGRICWKAGVVAVDSWDEAAALIDSASIRDAHGAAVVRAFTSAFIDEPYTRDEFKAAIARQKE